MPRTGLLPILPVSTAIPSPLAAANDFLSGDGTLRNPEGEIEPKNEQAKAAPPKLSLEGIAALHAIDNAGKGLGAVVEAVRIRMLYPSGSDHLFFAPGAYGRVSPSGNHVLFLDPEQILPYILIEQKLRANVSSRFEIGVRRTALQFDDKGAHPTEYLLGMLSGMLSGASREIYDNAVVYRVADEPRALLHALLRKEAAKAARYAPLMPQLPSYKNTENISVQAFGAMPDFSFMLPNPYAPSIGLFMPQQYKGIDTIPDSSVAYPINAMRQMPAILPQQGNLRLSANNAAAPAYSGNPAHMQPSSLHLILPAAKGVLAHDAQPAKLANYAQKLPVYAGTKVPAGIRITAVKAHGGDTRLVLHGKEILLNVNQAYPPISNDNTKLRAIGSLESRMPYVRRDAIVGVKPANSNYPLQMPSMQSIDFVVQKAAPMQNPISARNGWHALESIFASPFSGSNDNLEKKPYIDNLGNVAKGTDVVYDKVLGRDDLRTIAQGNLLEYLVNAVNDGNKSKAAIRTDSYNNIRVGGSGKGEIMIDVNDPEGSFYEILVNGKFPDFDPRKDNPLLYLKLKSGDRITVIKHNRDFYVSTLKSKEPCEMKSKRIRLDAGNEPVYVEDLVAITLGEWGYSRAQIDRFYDVGAISISAQKEIGQMGGDRILKGKISPQQYVSVEIALDVQYIKNAEKKAA